MVTRSRRVRKQRGGVRKNKTYRQKSRQSKNNRYTQRGGEYEYENTLMQYIKHSKIAEAIKLLDTTNLNLKVGFRGIIDNDANRYTPLGLACKLDNVLVALKLLAVGADPAPSDYDIAKPLDIIKDAEGKIKPNFIGIHALLINENTEDRKKNASLQFAAATAGNARSKRIAMMTGYSTLSKPLPTTVPNAHTFNE